MSLINSRTRFAVDSATGRVFCYLTSRYYDATGELKAPDGTWDLAKVKELVLAGKGIEAALVKAAPSTEDKVEKANADFKAAIDGLETDPATPPPAA
jgi:hypothetical protein